MPEEPVVEKPNEGISTKPEETKPEMIEKAKFDERDVMAKQYEVIQAKADALGYDDVEEYLEDLEIQAVAAETPPDKKPEEKKVEKKTETAQPEVTREDLRKTQETAAAGIFESQYTAFSLMQSSRKEEDRCTIPREELHKLITSSTKGPLIGKLAQDKEFGGNLYLAAEHYNLLISGKSVFRKQGADAEKAINKAAESAASDESAALKTKEDKTPEEENAARAGAIAPDDEYVFRDSG